MNNTTTTKLLSYEEALFIASSNCWSSLKFDFKRFEEFGHYDQNTLKNYILVQRLMKEVSAEKHANRSLWTKIMDMVA